MTKKIIETLLILGFGIYNSMLIISGDIDKYVNPRYLPLTIAMTFATLFFGFYLLLHVLNKKLNKTEILLLVEVAIIVIALAINLFIIAFGISIFVILSNKKVVKYLSNFNVLILISVLAIGLFLPTKALSSITAVDRISDFNAVAGKESKGNSIKYSFETESYTLGDWVLAFATDPNTQNYIEKKANVEGFVFKPENLPDDYFIVAKFLIRCCAVDATPTGIIVNQSNWNEKYSENDWVNVSGMFAISDELGDYSGLYIQNPIIKSIDEPDDPYIY